MSLVISSPGAPASTSSMLMPAVGRLGAGSVFTSTGSGSAWRAFVIHILVPRTT